MKRSKSVQSIEIQKSINEIFFKAASVYAEHIMCPQSVLEPKKNVFGRQVEVHLKSKLSHLQGIASGGVRCAAHLDAGNAIEQLQTIKDLLRQQIPMSIMVSGESMSCLPMLANSGAIIFQSHTAQETYDQLLLAQQIAEQSLCPVIVLASPELHTESITEVDGSSSQLFFGEPDGFAETANTAQEILFGKKRKRMPQWYNADLPALLGAQKDLEYNNLETAAKQIFFRSHLDDIIKTVQDNFEQVFGRPCSSFNYTGAKQPKQLIISTASCPLDAKEIERTSGLFGLSGGVALLVLKQLNPLPKLEVLSEKKLGGINLIESIGSAAGKGWLLKELSILDAVNTQSMRSFWYSRTPNTTSWRGIIARINGKSDAQSDRWIDLPITLKNSAYPKHEILIQKLNKSYPELENLSMYDQAEKHGTKSRMTAPSEAKRYADKGPAYSRLSRFYDDTACFYEADRNEIIADPFQAIPLVPASASLYINHAKSRSEFPVFRPQKARGFESYVLSCPQFALSTKLLSFEAILKNAIKLANKKGKKIFKIVPLIKKISLASGKMGSQNAAEVCTLGDILPQAFEQVLSSTKNDEEAKAVIEHEFELISKDLNEVPIALNQAYFLEPEKSTPGMGEVLTLSFNPSTCSACGLCASSCSDGSIRMEAFDESKMDSISKGHDLFNNLPDTSKETIDRLLLESSNDPFAALMLSEAFSKTLEGGSVDDEYASERSMVHAMLALLKYQRSGSRVLLDKELGSSITKLNSSFKKTLSDALPVTHLDSLMEVLKERSEERLTMDRIVKEWGQQEAFKSMDKRMLQRKLGLIEGLKEWRWSHKEGLTGTGSAGYTVIIDQSIRWAAEYPWNNFTVPATLASKGETLSLALGTFTGQLRHFIDRIKLLRRAHLEATNKYDPSVHDVQIAALRWESLTADEQKLMPPVVILGTIDSLKTESLYDLNRAFHSGYPIKLLLLDPATPGLTNANEAFSSTSNAYMNFISAKSLFIAKGSISKANELFTMLNEAYQYEGPAFITVLCPNAFAHEIDPQNWRRLMDLAIRTRAFNPFIFRPDHSEISFGKQFSTDSLPEIDRDWTTVTLKAIEQEEEVEYQYQPTWADWAFSLQEWQSEFKQLKNPENSLPVAAYLNLLENERQQKVPVVLRVSKEGNLNRYEAGAKVVELSENCRNSFRLLREISGMYTEFPESLEEKVESRLQERFDHNRADLEARLEKEKKEWEEGHTLKLRNEIRDRLVELSVKNA